jgi:hypothetical protein
LDGAGAEQLPAPLDTRTRVSYHLAFGYAIMNMRADLAKTGKKSGSARRWRPVLYHHRFRP